MKKEQPVKNYQPGSTSWSAGFSGLGGKSVGFYMVVDEKKALVIIRDLLKKKRKIKYAELGLDGDFIENSTVIYDGKKFFKYDAWRRSLWAETILIVNFKDNSSETYKCWKKGRKDEDL